MSEMPPPPPPPAGPPTAAPAAAMSPEDQRLWATLDHIGGIFFGWISTLVVYLVLKDRGGFIAQHARTALNFHLTMLIAMVVGWFLSATFILAIVGIPLILAAYVVIIVFAIIAAVRANKGELYSYPLTIPFIK